ncbi:unnamed protein product, partial [Didymodactylos carnosus]
PIETASCEAFTKPPPLSMCTPATWNKNGITVAGVNGINGSFATHLFQPQGIFIDQFDNLYVADSENDRIQKFVQGSNVGVTVAGGNGRGSRTDQLSLPTDVFVNSVGDIIVADYYNNRTQRWSVDGAQYITTIDQSSSSRPDDVFGNKQGDIYVSTFGSGRIVKYSSMNSKIVATDLVYPTGIVVDQCDTVYIADHTQHYVKKFTNQSLIGTTILGVKNESGTDSLHLNYPTDITLDLYGNLYIAERLNHRIQRVNVRDNTVDTILGSAQGIAGNDSKHLNCAEGIAFDSQWNLYVSDCKNHRIQKFLFESGKLYC